jgi:hypothetical protein
MNDDSSEGANAVQSANKLRTYSKEQKAQWVAKYQASGLTLRAFSEQNNIGYMSLWRWLRRSEKPVAEALAPAIFTELKLPSAGANCAWAVELTLPNGTVLRMTKDTPPALVEPLLRVC